MLEHIIQTTAYPKALLTFHLHLVSQITDDFHLFAASMNACIALANKAGLNQKVAPVAALTLQISEEQTQFKVSHVPSPGSGAVVDVVFSSDLEVVHMESSLSGDSAIDIFGALMSCEGSLTKEVGGLIRLNYM